MKQTILNVIGDVVSDFAYYDRKESETLPLGAIENAIKDKIITVDEICQEFAVQLRKCLGEQIQ